FTYNQPRPASSAAFRVLGAANDHLGANVITVDLDGDGYRDIVMSAPTTGRVYVVFGGPALAGTRDLSAAAADVTITVDAVPLSFAAGDFNKDGFADLAIGDPAAGPGGAAYLVNGRPRAMLSTLFPITAADAVFAGSDAGDAAGTTLDAADFDSDGVIDLIVGAPNGAGPNNARAGAGEAYVLFGRTGFVQSGSLPAVAGPAFFWARAGEHPAAGARPGRPPPAMPPRPLRPPA